MAGAVQSAARELDFDRYLAALLAPDKARPGLLAVAAFHGEIARIPLVVNEPAIGDVRLQWWRDAIVQPQGTRTGNPVADAVRAAMRSYALPAHTLLEIVDAYERLLEPGSAASASALEAYCAGTQGAVFRLAGLILMGTGAAQPLLAAAGQSCGRIQLLRALPLLTAKGRDPFPPGEMAGKLDALLRAAADELQRARQLVTSAPPTILPAILPLALVEPYLKALQKLDSRVAEQRAEISALNRAWRLLKASALRRV